MTETELHKATEAWSATEVLKLLETESGQAMAKETDKDGNLPLHKACARVRINLIEKLIDVFPKGVESKSKNGHLPLHYAAARAGCSQKAALDLLIPEYPEGLLCNDNHGNLPIHRAEDAQVFLHLATICPESLNVQNVWHRRPIVSWLLAHKFAKHRAETVDNIMLINAQKADEDKKKLQAEMNKIKDDLASVTKDLVYEKKMTNEARKIEKEFRSHLLDPENAAAATIDTLKSFAGSLKTRLDLTKAKLQNPSTNDNNSSMVQLTFASFIKDPDVSRTSLVHFIELLDAELSSLEQLCHQDTEENQTDAATSSNSDDGGDINQGATETPSGTADKSTPTKKRARVSIA
jgi:hypothetical protein